MARLGRKRCVARAHIAAAPITPLEVMLEAMHWHYEAGNVDRAAELAKDAAPYVHARLATIQMEAAVDHRYELVYTNDFYSRLEPGEANGNGHAPKTNT